MPRGKSSTKHNNKSWQEQLRDAIKDGDRLVVIGRTLATETTKTTPAGLKYPTHKVVLTGSYEDGLIKGHQQQKEMMKFVLGCIKGIL